MATVGFGDVYRYGARFFGYLLVVGGLAGVFIGGGAYLASDVMTITDPSLSDLSETRAFVGVLGMAIGAILGTVGFFGLAHKLLTESMGRALAAQGDVEELVVPEEADESEEETTETSDRATERESGPVPVEDQGPPEPESASSGGGGPTDRDPPAGATDRQPPREPASTEPSAGHTGGDRPAPEEPGSAEPAADQPAADAGVTDKPTYEAPAHVEPADDTAGSPPPEPIEDDTTGVSGAQEDGEPARDVDDSPPEWTPPDPSEFETNDEPVAEPTESAEPADEPAPAGNQGPDPEELPDDETLADQGVESFQTGGEEDPLADRLPSDEE